MESRFPIQCVAIVATNHIWVKFFGSTAAIGYLNPGITHNITIVALASFITYTLIFSGCP